MNKISMISLYEREYELEVTQFIKENSIKALKAFENECKKDFLDSLDSSIHSTFDCSRTDKVTLNLRILLPTDEQFIKFKEDLTLLRKEHETNKSLTEKYKLELNNKENELTEKENNYYKEFIFIFKCIFVLFLIDLFKWIIY